MDYNLILDNIKNENYLTMLNNLKNFFNNEIYKENEISKNNFERINNLIFYFNNINKINYNKDIKSDINIRLSKIDNIIYKKKWSKLNTIQKKNKINEFINNNLNDDKYQYIKTKILDDFNQNKLTSKIINYDISQGKIIEIKKLNFINNNYIYN